VKLTKNKLRQIIKESLEQEMYNEKLLTLLFSGDKDAENQAFNLAETLNIDLVKIALDSFTLLFNGAGWERDSTGSRDSYTFSMGPDIQEYTIRYNPNVTFAAAKQNLKDLNIVSRLLKNNTKAHTEAHPGKQFPEKLANDERVQKFFSDKIHKGYGFFMF